MSTSSEMMIHSTFFYCLLCYYNSCCPLVNTLKLSKPEKGQMVEMHLIHMAQVGRIREKLNDKQLVEILINLNAKMPDNVSKVKYDRRRAAIDSDDEDNYGC